MAPACSVLFIDKLAYLLLAGEFLGSKVCLDICHQSHVIPFAVVQLYVLPHQVICMALMEFQLWGICPYRYHAKSGQRMYRIWQISSWHHEAL
jgi:hypothetical protein